MKSTDELENSRNLNDNCVKDVMRFAMSEKCLFCDIVQGRIPAEKIYEDEHVIAFNDIAPQAPVHVLIIPKEHLAGLKDLTDEHPALLSSIHQASLKIAQEKSVYECGFRLVVNSGPDAGQAVDHLHYHLLAGRKLNWPPG